MAGERLRLRLRVLNGLLGLGLTIPAVDSRRSAVADSVKEDILRKTGAVVIDTIEGLAVIADDPKHFEQVSAGKASVYPSEPAYLLRALTEIWPLEMALDDRADDALEILSIANAELSPRAKFLTTYLALERMIDRLARSEAAQNLIAEFQGQVQKSALDARDKDSLVGSLGNLKEQSFRNALLALADRITPALQIGGRPGRRFLSDCVDTRNSIAHDARLDDTLDLAKLSDGLRGFVMSLIWTRNRIPDVSVTVPPSTVQLDTFELRLL